ncbi:MAG: hypothetical protein OEV42_17575 [Deltaproteobacteria bacterium]|nr:hypothetical protein [Deltaproteobacteria bacterium]
MEKIYPELKPKERIEAIVENYIYPVVVDHGFRFVRSGISLKKDIKDFSYEIYFSRNHRNVDDIVCAFDVHAFVRGSGYSKWYKNIYNKKLENNLIVSAHNHYIPNWVDDEFKNGYDLAISDNAKILDSLLNNIHSSVLPFICQITDYESAIEAVKKEESYFKTPMLLDFCEILRDEKQAFNILSWFEKEQDCGTEFMNETLEQVSIRKHRL